MPDSPAADEVTLCASCEIRAATYLNFADQPLCCTCAQCDCGQIPCRRLDPALTCRATLATEHHGTVRCYFSAGHYRPGRMHEAWAGGARRGWTDDHPDAEPHTPDGSGRTVHPGTDGRPPAPPDNSGRPGPDTPEAHRPPVVTSTDGSRPGEDGTHPDGSRPAVRDRRAEVHQAVTAAFLDNDPGLIAVAGLLDGPDRCTCGQTGELLAVDPAGAHAHAAPPCPFCEIVAGRGPAEIVREWPDALAIVPLGPVTDGHTLVIPKTHVEDFAAASYVSAMTMHRAADLAGEIGTPMNLITSRGPEATQTVPHLHLHLVPRAHGDGLALPWDPGQPQGDTR